MIKSYFVTPVRFDFGALALLPKELKTLGIARPLLVTDPGMVATGTAARVLELMPAGAAMFSDLPGNPTAENVAAAVAAYRAGAHDGLVALGGGSAIDCAKGAAVMATHPGELRDYDIVKVIRREGRAITPAALPIVAIPTSAGTGSEVTTIAVLTVGPGEKIVLINNNLLPRVTLADPELTLTLPRGLTAGTGMDALSHCLEAYFSSNENPPAKAVALDGIQRIVANIRTAYNEPQNRQARWEMMMGALEGGMTMLNGCGAMHAMAHAIGGRHGLNLHHGTLNAVLMPWVLEYNRPHCPALFARLEKALELPADTGFIDVVRRLNADLNIPRGLGAMGITEAMIPALAGAAVRDVNTLTNPVRLDAAGYELLLRAAM
ncbi:MAG: iron-containing alcohol dehydrogenase [Pseudomonadales bacterium]|nr:iron-containing alcohol dehydrogenase [Pseudomonadales bacterium]MBP9033264.1 iron-containing alcohol dehydrogenase [Pseudomonadales bacterium]